MLLAIGCVAALAACGSSRAASTRRTASNSALAAARCMRSDGVPDFPDPRADGGWTINFAPSGDVQVDGTSFAGPAFTAAAKTCQFFALTPPGPVPEGQRRALLDFANCMRHHGFPDWADPTFPATGGIFGGGGPYHENTPGLKHATTTCNGTVLHQTGG